MNIVLITAGIDDFSRKFHQLPGNPCAIIELDDWTPTHKLRHFLRSCVGIVARNQRDNLARYARLQGMGYHAVPRTQKDKIQSIVKKESADLVITYGCPMIPVRYLDQPKYGAINIHDSLLPEYRGGDPLFWQVLHGVTETGITIHRLTDKLDSGPILRQVRIERPKYVSEKNLSHLLNVNVGFQALKATVLDIRDGKLNELPQPKNSDAPKAPNGARHDWQTIADSMELTDAQRSDVACFLGHTQSSNGSKTQPASRVEPIALETEATERV